MLDKEQPTHQQFAELSLDDEEEYIQPRKDNGKQEQGKSIWEAFVDEVGFMPYCYILACTERRRPTGRFSVRYRYFFSFPLFLSVQEAKRKSI